MTDSIVFRSEQAIEKLIQDYTFDTVLDIGCGYGHHSEVFRKHGKTVTSTDLASHVDGLVVGPYLELDFEPHDITWASHILEHQPNVNQFLKKLRKDTKTGGYTCITVPPLKHNIVGGHLMLWNAGLLMYHLVLAGFNCKDCSVKQYGYNISIIARAEDFDLPSLYYDEGDIELLKPWLPDFARQGFDGNIQEYNWR
jgi:SAM-dependent methyltransferase